MTEVKTAELNTWHLVCITRDGKVTMLKGLDLRTARETYKRLLPATRPVKWIDPGCKKCRNAQYYGSSSGCYLSSSSKDPDYLARVEPLGPDGVNLDPWHGVEPEVRYNYRCSCPPPPPPWDDGRADFWNNPALWDGIDPTKQMCWQRRPNEHLHSNVASDRRAKLNQRNPSDLRRNKRSQGVKPKRRTRQATPEQSYSDALTEALQSERMGA